MVAGHDSHLCAPSRIDKQRRCLFVLVFEREVGDVTGDDEMVGSLGRGGEHSQEVLATVDTTAPEDEIRVPRDSLVEDNAAPLRGCAREHMWIGDVCDADHL